MGRVVSYKGAQFRDGFLGELEDYCGGFPVCYRERSVLYQHSCS